MSKPPSKKTPPKAKPAAPKTKPGISKPGSSGEHQPKTFAIKPWTGEGQGEKIVVYGKSGIGKTTLAAMAPNPVFIGTDDGGRKIVNPKTGEPIQAIPDIESFQDVRDALSQDGLFDGFKTLVIDTYTKAEELVQAHILQTVKVNGQKPQSFRKFGWDGDRHILDHYRMLQSDLDRLARKGLNIILLCQHGQIKVANAEGNDYLEDGPFLQHRNDCSVREETKQWADHVLRVSYLELDVSEGQNNKPGKVVSDDTTRAVFSSGAQHFTAKSRPVKGGRVPPIVSFEDETDDAIWQYIFGEASA